MAQELSMRDAYPMGLLLALPSLSNIFASPMWGFVSDSSNSWAKTLNRQELASGWLETESDITGFRPKVSRDGCFF